MPSYLRGSLLGPLLFYLGLSQGLRLGLYASEGRRSHSPPRPHHQCCKLTHRGRVGSEDVIPHLCILHVGEGS